MYGNDPQRWPKTWAAFVILAPKLGLPADPNPWGDANVLTAWNWFLEGLRVAKGHMSHHELRMEVEGQ